MLSKVSKYPYNAAWTPFVLKSIDGNVGDTVTHNKLNYILGGNAKNSNETKFISLEYPSINHNNCNNNIILLLYNRGLSKLFNRI